MFQKYQILTRICIPLSHKNSRYCTDFDKYYCYSITIYTVIIGCLYNAAASTNQSVELDPIHIHLFY